MWTRSYKRAVLADLGVRPGRPNPKFGAYFVCVDPDELKYFTVLFRGNSPRTDLSDDKQGKFGNMEMEDGVVKDRITNLYGVIYAFQKVNIVNDKAEVEVAVSYGLLAITIHTYSLVLRDNQWTIGSHSRQTIS